MADTGVEQLERAALIAGRALFGGYFLYNGIKPLPAAGARGVVTWVDGS